MVLLVHLGKIAELFDAQTRQRREKAKVRSALPHLRDAATLISDYAQAHYDLGSVYLRQNELELARREFEMVLCLNPADYQAHGNLGYIYLRGRDPEQATRHFESALEINPDDPLAPRNLEIARRAQSLLRAKP